MKIQASNQPNIADGKAIDWKFECLPQSAGWIEQCLSTELVFSHESICQEEVKMVEDPVERIGQVNWAVKTESWLCLMAYEERRTVKRQQRDLG